MSQLLVDTNILLDIVGNDPHWADWSIQQIDAASVRHHLIINDVIYAEFSVGFTRVEDVDRFLADAGIERLAMASVSLFLAGKAFERYRRQGGTKTNVLPDFFIGAHAATAGIPILTRDARRYRTYFPTVALITPPVH